jgi:N-hydroxyarylamine O-acetyltransferase
VSIDLDAYFKRVGYAGGRKPTLATLRELHRRQPQAIAFENLSPMLGHPVPIDAPSLHNKMVTGGRGGYCYEQNLLFASVLEALGFKFRHLTGWPRWQVAPGQPLPRTHLLLLLNIENEDWLADVGFGGNTLTAPLLLRSRETQATPHEPARIVDHDGHLMVQVQIRNEWLNLVEFGLEQQNFPQLEMGNWFTSAHPRSRFKSELFLARADEGRRHTLYDNVLSMHRLGGETEKRTLGSAVEIRDALTEVFRIKLPSDPALNKMLEHAAGHA